MSNLKLGIEKVKDIIHKEGISYFDVDRIPMVVSTSFYNQSRNKFNLICLSR